MSSKDAAGWNSENEVDSSGQKSYNASNGTLMPDRWTQVPTVLDTTDLPAVTSTSSTSTSNSSVAEESLTGVNATSHNVGCTSTTTNSTTTTCTSSKQLWLTPVPNWDDARSTWGKAWPFHQYFFATVFLCLFLVSFSMLWRSVCRQRDRGRSPAGKLSRRAAGLLPPPVLCLISAATLLKAISLYSDPYHSESRMPTTLARTLADLPFTCFLSAYQLVFLAVRSSLRIRLNSLEWLENRVFLAVVILGFLIFNTVVDIVLTTVLPSRELLLICMIANILWLAAIISELIAIGLMIHRRIAKWTVKSPTSKRLRAALAGSYDFSLSPATRQQASIDTLNDGVFDSPGRHARLGSCLGSPSDRRPSLTVPSATSSRKPSRRPSIEVRTLISTRYLALSATIYFSFFFYYFLGVSGAISFKSLIVPWTWYGVATAYRLTEVFLVFTILRAVHSAKQARVPLLSKVRRSFLSSNRSQGSVFLDSGKGRDDRRALAGESPPDAKVRLNLDTVTPDLETTEYISVMYETAI